MPLPRLFAGFALGLVICSVLAAPPHIFFVVSMTGALLGAHWELRRMVRGLDDS